MVPTDSITKERLEKWAARLKEAHATPVFLLGVGHDHNLGRPVLCTLEEEDMPIDKLRDFVRLVLQELEK